MVVEDEEDEQILVLMRRDDPSPDEDLTEGGSLQELTRDILEFRITYAKGQEEDDDDELDGWGLEGSGGLPVRIKVRLVLKDKLNREHVFATSIHPELAGISERTGNGTETETDEPPR
jgi:hypothetical protein